MGLFLNLEKIRSFSEGAMGVRYVGYENSGTFLDLMSFLLEIGHYFDIMVIL